MWNDLREHMDPAAPVTVAKAFPYANGPIGIGSGNVTIDAGSFTPFVAGGGPLKYAQHRQLMSNTLLVSEKRSKSGHPIFVAGPQVGYYSPEILMEEDLHGGGLNARGVAFPGLGFYPQIGRGSDYAWSATSASSDVIDQFAETLCGNGTTQYLYKGQCRDMGSFDAGTLKGQAGGPDTELTYRTTVHGPGRRLRHVRRQEGRDLSRPLDSRARAARRDRVPDAVDGWRAQPAAVLRHDERLRAHVQLVLRRLEAHRDVLERTPASAQPEREPGTADLSLIHI